MPRAIVWSGREDSNLHLLAPKASRLPLPNGLSWSTRAWRPGRGSNSQPAVYKTAALPIELPGLPVAVAAAGWLPGQDSNLHDAVQIRASYPLDYQAFSWWTRRDSNPDAFRPALLRRVRMPIPPRVLVWWRRSDSNRRYPACRTGAFTSKLHPHRVLLAVPTRLELAASSSTVRRSRILSYGTSQHVYRLSMPAANRT